jgi:hypothetical protein
MWSTVQFLSNHTNKYFFLYFELYDACDLEHRLCKAYFDIDLIYSEKNEAEETFSDLYRLFK